VFEIRRDNIGIGVDIESISRFHGLTIEKDATFLNKIFTKKELDYCFSSGNPSQHLAARYAGKEAIIKALSLLDRAKPGYKDIEIVNDDRGIPHAGIQKKGFTDFEILLSLSHSHESAVAFTIIALRAGR
jgi:holo-[acyl-carrier protein] synthase